MLGRTALEYAANPRYQGPLEGATHEGYAEAPDGGPYAWIWLIVKDGRIAHATHRTNGCPSMVACGGGLCALVTHREAERARSLDAIGLAAFLGGLPEGKGYAPGIVVRAFHEALEHPLIPT